MFGFLACLLRHFQLFMLTLVFFSLPAPALALEAVTLQLKWSHAFQFAGYYAAKEKGYYREAGLDVSIQEAQPGDDPIKTVLDGKAQFGVGNSSLLLARKSGQPVVALAVIFQHSPLVLITRQQSPAQGIHDLVGKRVMLEPQTDELLAYLKQEGIPHDRITRIEHSFQLQDLIDGKVDAIAAYTTNQPYFLDRAGFAYHIYTPRSVGIDFYADNLFTTEHELKSYPARTKAFREASLRGWNYAMAHPQEIADLILAQYSQKNPRDFYLFEARQMVPLLRADLIEIGYMNPGRWRHIADTYADLGLLPKNYSLDGFLYNDRPELDLSWLYVAGALLAMLSGVTLYIHRNNRHLAVALATSRVSHELLRVSEERFRDIAEVSADWIWEVDSQACYTYASDSVATMLGYTPAEVLGKTPFDFMSPLEAQRVAPEFGSIIAAKRSFSDLENIVLAKDGTSHITLTSGTPILDKQGGLLGYRGIDRDISERKRLEDQIRQLAYHDPLTALPNRRQLNDHLIQAMAASKRMGCYGALMFLDLDNFKSINDTHGHALGDLLLIEAAERLKNCVRETDTVARLGGDEFVVLLNGLDADPSSSTSQAGTVAEKIRNSLSAPYRLSARHEGRSNTQVEHHCTASIGVAMFISHETSPDDIMNRADAAMYRAKASGRNSVQFAPDTQPQVAVKVALVQLNWRASYNCGHATIDGQHRRLFDDANQLLSAMLSGCPANQVAGLVDALARDVVQHFQDEEAIILAAGYPDVAQHAATHRELVDHAVELVARFHKGQLAVGELFQFLAYDLVARHILGADSAYFSYLKTGSASLNMTLGVVQ